MASEYGLIESVDESRGDTWEEIDVSDTEADKIARQQDREFLEFQKRIKDADQFKVSDAVFDDATFSALYKLVQDGYINAIGGPISTGKEANVHEALGGDGDTVAVKIYRINTSNFRQMQDYLEGDPRFEGISTDTKKVVLAWVKKEFSNLERALNAGVRVPEPIAVQRNVLVMEYLGTEQSAAPKLHDVNLENPHVAFDVVKEYMRRLYDVGLIHGDLSEYNMVIQNDRIYFIDVGQAITTHHPNSDAFLQRDCENIATYFSRQGIDISAEELREYLEAEAQPTP
ncbi:MAG: RIO1 family regulatory kinase/ATPase [Halobacteriaceae archaeon]